MTDSIADLVAAVAPIVIVGMQLWAQQLARKTAEAATAAAAAAQKAADVAAQSRRHIDDHLTKQDEAAEARHEARTAEHRDPNSRTRSTDRRDGGDEPDGSG